MMSKVSRWWSRLRINQKDLLVILLFAVPLLLAIGADVTLIRQLLTVQEQDKELLLARDHIRLLSRLAVDNG